MLEHTNPNFGSSRIGKNPWLKSVFNYGCSLVWTGAMAAQTWICQIIDKILPSGEKWPSGLSIFIKRWVERLRKKNCLQKIDQSGRFMRSQPTMPFVNSQGISRK